MSTAVRRSSRISAVKAAESMLFAKDIDEFVLSCYRLTDNQIYKAIHTMFKSDHAQATSYFLSFDAWEAYDIDEEVDRFVLRTVIDILGLSNELVVRFLQYYDFDNHELHKFGITYVNKNGSGHYRILTGYGC